MNLRLADDADWAVCAALSEAVQSTHVWQLNVERDPTQPLNTTDISVSLRCVRLPRPITAPPLAIPFDLAWNTAIATFVADEPELAGYVALQAALERRAVSVSRLVVAPAFRQQGLGTALLQTAARWARGQGYPALLAACPARNHPAVACLVRAGCTFAGYNEALYGRHDIALLWQRAT